MSKTTQGDDVGQGMFIPKGYLTTTEQTFQFDETLPSLPIPSLEKTLAKYLESGKETRFSSC